MRNTISLLYMFLLIFSFPTGAQNITLSSNIPSDVPGGVDASKQQLAQFAWQEFIALNWPAKPNPNPSAGMSKYFRGQADSSALASTGAGGTLVWHTYTHRVELYPYNAASGTDVLPDINAIPNYQYPSYVTIVPATPSTDLTLFNNQDEASEITLADMYFKPFALEAEKLMLKHGVRASHTEVADIEELAIKAGIIYEAKANPVIYNYINSKGFQAKSTRSAAAKETASKIHNEPYDANNTFELPSGSIEIKATWRRYDANLDNLDDYIHQTGIYYTGTDNNYTAHNDTLLLIGLHIIHKTPSFPEFTFATFEHVSNDKYGFIFKNTNPLTCSTPNIDRKLPDPGTIEAKRQYPIPGASSPFDLQAFNATVQKQLQDQLGSNVFLANYQLIGVQATVADAPSEKVPAQEFYLSNLATETNNSLQFFQGGLTGTFANVPNPSTKSVFAYDPSSQQYVAHASGGCQGCHGSQGQKGGYDFSVISANGNSFAPEAIEPYPGGLIIPQDPTGFPLSQTTTCTK